MCAALMVLATAVPAYVDGGFDALFERRIKKGLYVAVTAASIAVLVSSFHIYQHLRFFSVPSEQKFVIRLILLVPIYSLQSSLSLALPNLSIFLSAVRDSYEAYVIYTFMALLITVLGGEAALVDILENVRPFKHPWPLTHYLPSVQPGRAFMLRCKMGTLQFVFIKPLTALLAVVLYHYGMYVVPPPPTPPPSSPSSPSSSSSLASLAATKPKISIVSMRLE